MRKELTGFVICLIVAALFAFFGKDSYESTLNQPLLDSLANQRQLNSIKLDSLILVNDSLRVEVIKSDTVIIEIKKYEKVWINSVDTIHSDSISSAIRKYLHY